MTHASYDNPFSLLHAVNLLSQQSRIDKFSRAIEDLVTADSTVFDIGTGTGILAFLAAKAGAKSVIGIDISKQNIEYARRASEINKLGKQIEFIVAHFDEFMTETKADIIICEMLSSMLLVEQQIPAVLRANERLLAENGTILPKSTTVYVVPVQSDYIWNRYQVAGFEFPKMPQTVGGFDEVDDLADMQSLFHVEYRNLNTDFRVSEELSFDIIKNGTVHGLVGMFEADLIPNVTLRPEDGWKHLFIPLEEERRVQKGESIALQIEYIPGEFDSISLVIEN
jgi:predicted RNA methylase